jgi:hypothetical protein
LHGTSEHGDEHGNDGASTALQRSDSQDSWCSVTSTDYSETSDHKEDHSAATSVSAGPLASVDQPPSSQSDRLIRESDTPYQEPWMPSANLYTTHPDNGLVPPTLYPGLDQMSQDDILSQNSSQPLPRGHEIPSISPSSAAYSPWQNDPHLWAEITQPAGASGQIAGYLASLRPCALPSAGFHHRPALPETCRTQPDFTRPSRHFPCHGFCAYNSVDLEPTPSVPQLGGNSLTRMSSDFGSPNSSGLREHTVPDHLFNINAPSERVISQQSGV